MDVMSENLLYDRFVDIVLTDINGKSVSILTPTTGRKPEVQISGQILMSPVLSNINVRIVNFYSPVPLGDYVSIDITAGYRNNSLASTTISGALNTSGGSASIQGMGVGWAYQETPSPDGVTNFVMILGDYDNWTANVGDYKATSGTSIIQILTDISTKLSLTANFGPGFDNINWQSNVPFQPSGKLKDIILQTCRGFNKNFVYRIEGKNIYFFWQYTGIQTIALQAKSITYISSPPKRNGPSSISFVAPWRPDIRPGDLIKIDPVYAKMNFGGSFTTGVTEAIYVVNTIDFDFSTVGGTNSMRVEALVYVAGGASSPPRGSL